MGVEVLIRLCVTVGAAAVCVSVCACNGPIYDPAGRTFPDAITPQNRWDATGNLEGTPKAIDGSIATAA